MPPGSLSSDMQSQNSFPVPDDVVDSILMSLPHFSSLYSTIRVSKSIYANFGCRPTSIIWAVAYNEVGPALPQALRLVRYNSDVHKTNPDNWPEESILTNTPVTRTEADLLAVNVRVVRALEDLYSWRCKNRASPQSKLSAVESLRFQRAMYRLWLYSVAFPPLVNNVAQTNHEDKVSFLEQLGTPELFEFAEVCEFMRQIIEWVAVSTLDSGAVDPDLALYFGPTQVLGMYELGQIPPQAIWLHTGQGLVPSFMREALTAVIKNKGIDEPDWNSLQMQKVTLDEVEHGDRCDKCGGQNPALWSEPNWPLLKGCIRPHDIARLLDGLLWKNTVETGSLKLYMCKRLFSYTSMLNYMFDNRDDEQDGWSKSDWYCVNCLKDFIRLHLRSWWLVQKQADGQRIAEDCWYGYNCRTQVHRYPHALRLNHLCTPVRGEAPESA